MPIQKNLDGQENILYWARRKDYLGRNLALFEPKLSYSSTGATKKSTELSDYQEIRHTLYDSHFSNKLDDKIKYATTAPYF